MGDRPEEYGDQSSSVRKDTAFGFQTLCSDTEAHPHAAGQVHQQNRQLLPQQIRGASAILPLAHQEGRWPRGHFETASPAPELRIAESHPTLLTMRQSWPDGAVHPNAERVDSFSQG